MAPDVFRPPGGEWARTCRRPASYLPLLNWLHSQPLATWLHRTHGGPGAPSKSAAPVLRVSALQESMRRAGEAATRAQGGSSQNLYAEGAVDSPQQLPPSTGKKSSECFCSLQPANLSIAGAAAPAGQGFGRAPWGARWWRQSIARGGAAPRAPYRTHVHRTAHMLDLLGVMQHHPPAQ